MIMPQAPTTRAQNVLPRNQKMSHNHFMLSAKVWLHYAWCRLPFPQPRPPWGGRNLQEPRMQDPAVASVTTPRRRFALACPVGLS